MTILLPSALNILQGLYPPRPSPATFSSSITGLASGLSVRKIERNKIKNPFLTLCIPLAQFSAKSTCGILRFPLNGNVLNPKHLPRTPHQTVPMPTEADGQLHFFH